MCGMYSYVCAVAASGSAVSDPGSARRLGNASIGVSVAGIVVSVIIVIVVAIYLNCPYSYNGTCYSHYKYVGSYGSCSGVRSGDVCYYN